METAPEIGVFLVQLESNMAGTHFHVMQRRKASNGIIEVIGGVFGFDAPKPLLWTEIEPPVEVPS